MKINTLKWVKRLFIGVTDKYTGEKDPEKKLATGRALENLHKNIPAQKLSDNYKLNDSKTGASTKATLTLFNNVNTAVTNAVKAILNGTSAFSILNFKRKFTDICDTYTDKSTLKLATAKAVSALWATRKHDISSNSKNELASTELTHQLLEKINKTSCIPSRVVCFQRTEDPKQCGDKAVYSIVNASGHGTYTPSKGTKYLKIITVGAGSWDGGGGSGGGTVVAYTKVPNKIATIAVGKRALKKEAGGSSSIMFDGIAITATGGAVQENVGGFGTITGSFGSIHRGMGSAGDWGGNSGLSMSPQCCKANKQLQFPGSGICKDTGYKYGGNGTVWIFEFGELATYNSEKAIPEKAIVIDKTSKRYANILQSEDFDEFAIGEIVDYEPEQFFTEDIFIECPDYVDIGSLYIDGKFTTPAPEHRELYDYDWDKQEWFLDDSKKNNAIDIISEIVIENTEKRMKEIRYGKNLLQDEPLVFDNEENARKFIKSLSEKSMQELIELLP